MGALTVMPETWVQSLGREGRSPGGGHGSPLQYACLEKPMDRGTWRATVHGVAKSQNDWVTNTFILSVSGLQGSVNLWDCLHTFVYVNNLVSEHQVCKWSLSKSQRKIPLGLLKVYIFKSWINSKSMTLIMNKSLHCFTSSSPYCKISIIIGSEHKRQTEY